MATDGSLIFNTKMNTSGFDKGVEQISSRILELRNKVKTTENQISSLQDELENLSKTEIKTKISEQLEKDVAKAKENLKSLYAQADKIGDSKKNDLVSMGFGTEHLDSMLAQDEHWQKLQSEIDKAEEALSSYEAELKSVRATEAQIDPTSTAEYKEKKQKLEGLIRQLDIYKAKLQETEAKENGTASKTKKVSDIFDRFKKCVSKAGRSLSSAFKAGAVNLIKKIGGHAKKSASEMGGLAKTFNSIKRALQGMIIYQGISKILDSIKVGMQNLAQASPETNKSLSMLMTSLTYLKNTLATAFAPILNAVAPILNYFINLLAQVTDKIGQFMAALTGQKTYTKAVKVQQDYAESIKDTTSATEKNTKATDENQKWLSGYDELNVMQDNKASADSSDDKNTITPSDMFTTETVSNGISGFANQLKSLIEAEDFSGVGHLIGSKINSALSNINWNKIRNTSKKWAKNLANFLNGGMLEIDWKLVGKSIGNGLMTAFDFAYTFLTKFDFKMLGTKIADALNGLFTSINWSTVGGTFGAALQGIIATGFGFVTTFDWSTAGLSLSETVNGFFAQIDWAMAAQTLSDGILGMFTTLTTFVQEVNWGQIGEGIGNFLTNLINIDFTPVVEAVSNLGEAFGKLLKACGYKLKSAYKNILLPLAKWTIEKVVPKLVETLSKALEFLAKCIKKVPVSVIAGISAAIGTIVIALKGFKIAKTFKSYISTLQTAFKTLKTSIMSHPYAATITLIVTAITSLAAAIKTYTNEKWENSSLKKEIDKTKELTEEWSGLANEMQSKIDDINDSELTMKVDFENVQKMKDKLQEIIEDGTIDESEKGEYKTIVDLLSEKVDGFDTQWNSLTLEEINGEIVIKDNIDTVTKNLDDLITKWEIAQVKMTYGQVYSDLQTEIAKKQVAVDLLKQKDNAKTRTASFVDYVLENSHYSRKESEIVVDEILKANGDLEKAKKSLQKQFDDGALDIIKYRSLFNEVNNFQIGETTLGIGGWKSDIKDYIKESIDEISNYKEETSRASDELNFFKEKQEEYKDVLEAVNGTTKDYSYYIELVNDGVLSQDSVLSLLKDDGITTWEQLEKAAAESSGGTVNHTKKVDKALSDGAGSYQNYEVAVSKSTSGIKKSVDSVPSMCESMLEGLKKALEPTASIFSNAFSGIWDELQNPMNFILGKVEEFVNTFNSGLSHVGGEILNGAGTAASIIAGATIPNYRIPKLATGTYVPAHYGEFLAVLGDNKREAEVVSPISAMKQAMSETLAEFSSTGTGGNGDLHLTVELDGEVLARKTIKWNEAYKNRHGKSAFL